MDFLVQAYLFENKVFFEKFMNEEEAKQSIANLEKYTAETTSTKEKARQALIDAGLVKSNGQPTDFYKN